MLSPNRVVRTLVAAISPADELEDAHRQGTLSWLDATADIYRRAKPATPPKHLVSYVVPVDPSDGGVFLIDHLAAGLRLPPGGHVEPGEHPAEAARRETREELGIDADFGVAGDGPLFLTVTPTVGPDSHLDVSLWFAIRASRQTAMSLDPREFGGGRWWTPAQIAAAGPEDFDPHLARFLRKLGH